jgi:hypothetical protein
MSFDDQINQNNANSSNTPSPISWWSWRPGIQPQNALLIGIPLAFITLLITIFGLLTLIAGIQDSMSPPLLVPGIVRHRSLATQTSPAQLMLHLHAPNGIPSDVSFVASNYIAQQISINATVTVNYSQHLHFAYALDYAGHHYLLPGTTAAGNPLSSIALLSIGLLLLPYPALLTHWGWQDLLIERYKRDKRATMTARVVDKRNTPTTRTARPGFTGRGTRPWYGLALLPLDANRTRRNIYTFSVNEETWTHIRQDTRVKIVYAPHVHYVYSIHTENA